MCLMPLTRRALQAELARYLGILEISAVARLKSCLASYELPTSIKDNTIQRRSAYRHCSVDQLLTVMGIDKKNQGGKKRVVLLQAIGQVHGREATVVADQDIRVILSSGIKVIPSIPESLKVCCTPPGSKSISNRALLLAALGTGKCRMKNFLQSDDTKVMMTALTQMQAATFTWEDDSKSPTLVVTGRGGQLRANSEDLYLGNAGTASRFLTTAVTLAKPGLASHSIVTGNKRMQQRPIGDLVDALRKNGADISYMCDVDDKDSKVQALPLKIKATEGIEGGNIDLAANFSSQYVSSILMCAPFAKKPVTLRLVGGKPISQLYIDLTIAMMRTFGIQVTKSTSMEHTYHIPQGSYYNPSEYEIESDASSATYPLAIAAITGTSCTVPNIGSSSLQGDARFATDVLKPMGCKVHQDERSTTVTGPEKGALKPIPLIDMEPMTDAFLTASVLAAVAQGSDGRSTTKIIGIKNQHKKECDRIEAMEKELLKFGVVCRGSEDGIEIDGMNYTDLKEPLGGIHCYDDHRVAMSFSVLSLVAPEGTVIQERECVGKTWPGWWDTLRGTFNVDLQGIDLDRPSRKAGSAADPQKSIYVIGMRGAGKTTTGKMIADLLDWHFTDLDSLLETNHGRGIPDIIEEHGWEGFREQELATLKTVLKEKPQRNVFACGGGIVETAEARRILIDYQKSGGRVILIQRDIEDIMAYLQLDKSRPAYKDDMKSVWLRRREWYVECSNFEYHTPKQESDLLSRAANGLERFVGTVTGRRQPFDDVKTKDRSFFVSLTIPDIRGALSVLPEVVVGVDAVELRVDLLQDPKNPQPPPSREYVAQQLALLQTAIDVPIIFTVRTQSQGGKFPDTEEDAAFVLYELALRMGVEYLDLEIYFTEAKLRSITTKKGSTRIIASHHDPKGTLTWSNNAWVPHYNKALLFGDVVKLVGLATSMQDNTELEKFKTWTRSQSDIPVIAINMGRNGQRSRIDNTFLTPVSHPALPFKAAPGQMSAMEIRTALTLHGEIKPRRFYLFGTPITQSKSPAMHNTCFQNAGLPYSYDLFETDNAQDLQQILRADDFGGASVTIPLKLNIMPLLDEISDDAKVIGAVNTVVVHPSPTIDASKRYGQNTDWKGMVKVLESAGARPSHDHQSGLVIGGGGTARAAIYALHTMGYSPIHVLTRSHKKGQDLITSFPKEYDLRILSTVKDVTDTVVPRVAIGTIPGDRAVDDTMAAVLTQIFHQSNGILLEMAYKPAVTPLMKLARTWKTVPGLEVLAAQAYHQSIAWTGITPMYSMLRKECGLPL